VVATGILEEHCPGGQRCVIHPGELCAFGSDCSHDVLNVSIAAASLQDIGFWQATDVIGGFQAWRTADLPVVLANR
jgi:hypothetical protein